MNLGRFHKLSITVRYCEWGTVPLCGFCGHIACICDDRSSQNHSAAQCLTAAIGFADAVGSDSALRELGSGSRISSGVVIDGRVCSLSLGGARWF